MYAAIKTLHSGVIQAGVGGGRVGGGVQAVPVCAVHRRLCCPGQIQPTCLPQDTCIVNTEFAKHTSNINNRMHSAPWDCAQMPAQNTSIVKGFQSNPMDSRTTLLLLTQT